MNTIDILAFGAHPDDVELGCGATLAKAVAHGKKVGVVDLTKGELGTRGSADLRSKEAADAAAILGIDFRINLGFKDGFFINDAHHQLEIIKVIRKYQPKTVLCNAETDRHIDHGRAAKLVSDACFLSGLIKIDTKQQAWRPKQVFHYLQWNMATPDFVVDVSDYLNIKIEAVSAYSSQFFDPKSEAPETPISSKNFFDSIRYRAADLGRLTGLAYAEGFTSKNLLAVENFEALL